MSFVVFSDDWGTHPSSCQHLFRHISQLQKTVWVNTVGMRAPRLSIEDFKKAVKKVTAMVRTKKVRQLCEEDGRPIVCAPFMMPFDRPRWLSEWNSRSVLRTVAEAIAQHGLHDICAVTTVPNVYRALTKIGAEKIIYYCVDDFSEWPGFDKSIILDMENELLKSVEAIICTSEALQARFSSRYPTTLLTHGVDIELFSRPVKAVHPLLERIPEPRVGYYGLFDPRTDMDLLIGIAGALPQVSFVITGPTQGDVSRARGVQNIHLTGPVPYADLPAVVHGWKACLLPYLINDLTVQINPLKLKEYLATGKPVISTPLPEASKLLPHLRIATTTTDWVAAVLDAVSGRWQQDCAQVLALLRPHAWAEKARQFLNVCETV